MLTLDKRLNIVKLPWKHNVMEKVYPKCVFPSSSCKENHLPIIFNDIKNSFESVSVVATWWEMSFGVNRALKSSKVGL